MTRIREFAERDIPAVDALWADGAVPFSGAENAWRIAATIPACMLVAEEEPTGAIVGFGSVLQRAMWRGAYAPLRLRVAGHARGAGVGRALWASLAVAREAWPSGRFVAQVDRDDHLSRETAARHGGVETDLHLVSHLDLTTIAALPLPPDPRLVIHRPDLADASERDRLYRFLIERGEDAPDVGPGAVLLPREMFDLWFTEDWQAVVLRIDGDDVALTTATGEGEDAHIVFTGVVPALRGRGVATWVKQVHADAMRRSGFRRLRTENMAGNDAILAVNARAGFRQSGGYLDVEFDPA